MGVCEDTMQLNTLLQTEQPDLLFLDIEMPYLSGLELLASLAHPPHVIITSAYEQYALKGYELDVDLPGYKKEDVKAELKDGYLTISASNDNTKEEKDEDGKYIRKERYTGAVSRSFYVGEGIHQEDVNASFDNGELKIVVPKESPKQIEENKFIPIE